MDHRLTQLLSTGFIFQTCAFAVFLAFAGCGTREEIAQPMERMPVKQMSLQGMNINYLDMGEGDPLVLVHGIPTSSFLWRNMIRELAAHGRIIALDLPGFGLSDAPLGGDYSISNYARIFESFMTALEIERATLVCHDYGGPVVLTYALLRPEKYRRLIILDTFLHNDLPPLPFSMKIAGIWPIGEIIMALSGQSVARSGLEMGVADKTKITDELVRIYYSPDGDTDKIGRSMLGTLRADYSEEIAFIEKNLGTVDKPTLIIWGEDDKYLPIHLGQRIHQDIPGSTMHTIPNCGHFVQEDQPKSATRIIEAFLNDTKEP